MNRRKKQPWFIKIRGSYLPSSWQGWLSYVPFCGYLFGVTLYAFQTRQSAAEMVYFILPQWVAAAVVLTWVASQKS